MTRRVLQTIILILLVAGAAAAIWLPACERALGSYCTSLHGRTRGQRMNAVRAARALDGAVIAPGATLSFNKTVGSWTPDRGYVCAPVSYDGELVVDWGGGVCQTSSTLYNAALIAGLEVAERHRHTWLPSYVPPGRDAAVAQLTTDLRVRNPYAFPVRLRARIEAESLGIEVVGRDAGPMAAVSGDAATTVQPSEVCRTNDRLSGAQPRVIAHGRPGVRVGVYRAFLRGPRAGQRELVSQDAYPAMHRVVTVRQ